MSFLRDAAVDLVVALKGHTLTREAAIALHRLSNEIVRSEEVSEAQKKRKHSCPDWDYMVIDEDSPEFDCCLCYKEGQPEARLICTKCGVDRFKQRCKLPSDCPIQGQTRI